MTGDQWFVVAQSAVGALAVIGGLLAGSYVYRKGRAIDGRARADPAASDVWLTVGLAAALLVVTTLLVLLWAAYAAQRADLDVACNGIIASLDLTEWVNLCRR